MGIKTEGRREGGIGGSGREEGRGDGGGKRREVEGGEEEVKYDFKACGSM